MKIKWPKNLGHIVTNVSFIAFALALVVIIGGRIFAEDTTTSTSTDTSTTSENTDYMENAVLNWQSGGSASSGEVTSLNENYINSNDRVTEFFEGSECEIANIDCFTKNYQSAQILGYTALTAGRKTTGSNAETADGAIQGISKMISWTFQPQASGAYYVADALQNMGVVSPTYAQGFGYYSLSPYLKLWRVFRNIAYIFFTVVIIAIGFMILLRQKAGGQAAVTAQQALPRIVTALILVTFSYAIAGFCIDLMYWLMYAFSSFLNFNDGSINSANVLVNGSFLNVLNIVMTGNGQNIFQSVNDATTSLLKNMVGDGWGDVLGGIAGFIGSFIILIALLSALFRLLFILLKSYAIILLNIIFAPLSLMMVAISGGKAFENWIKSIIANLSPFIITFFMLVIVGTLNAFFKNSTGTASVNNGPIYAEANGQVNAQGFAPPYLLGFNGTGAVSNLGTIVGLAIALAIPELVENIKKKLGGDAGIFGQVMSDAAKTFEKARKGKIAKTLGGAATGLALTGAGAGLSRIRGRIAARQQEVGTLKKEFQYKKDRELERLDSSIDAGSNKMSELNKAFRVAKKSGDIEKMAELEKQRKEQRKELKKQKNKRTTVGATEWQDVKKAMKADKDSGADLWGDGTTLTAYNDFKNNRKEAVRQYAQNRYNGSTFMTRVVKRTKQGPWGAAKNAVMEPFEERSKKHEEYANLITLATNIQKLGTAYGYSQEDKDAANRWLETNGTYNNWRQKNFPTFNIKR